MTKKKPITHVIQRDNTIQPVPAIKHTPGRRPKTYSQATRIVLMTRALVSRACTIKELAQDFDVNIRQVHRDLDEIEAQGHPLTCSEGPGEKTWELPRAYAGLPPIALDRYQLMALQLARANLSHLKGTPFLEDLGSVIDKVKASLPRATANHLDRIMQVFAPIQRGARSYAGQSNLIKQLRTALLLQRTVELIYQKPYVGKAVRYRVNPYAIVLYDNGLYLVGYSHGSHGDRQFAVDRLKQVKMTEDTFEIPPSFSTVTRFADQFGLVEEPPQEVKIQFSSDVAHFMLERTWHPSQRIKKLKGGAVEVTLHAGGLDEIAWWVLSWGKEAKVLSPPKLIKIVASQLAKTLKQYPSR